MVETKRQFTLLLVDDNPTNVLLLVKIIELDLPEVRVLTAANAMDGLKLAEQEPIDGAFIDVQMPQMDGLEMCRQLRLMPRIATIPLVLMTAHIASPEMRAEGLAVGAYDFISQPISNVEMLARIKVMLRLCESEQRSLENNQHLQQQLTEQVDHLRWISGLLISGDGPLAELDQQLLRHLANELPDPTKIDEKLFFEKLLTEFPLPWRRTLLKLSLLDRIPVSLAQKLSEITDVAAVFDYLSRHLLSLIQPLDGENHLFLSPQIRDLLRAKVEQYLSESERQQVCLTAADWYRQKNDLSAAFEVLISAEQYSAVSQFLSQVGLSLLAKKHRSRVFSLINQIPEKIVITCGWMALFRGIHCLQEQSTETDVWLKLAYHHFGHAGDTRGELLALVQQVSQSLFLEGSFESWSQRLPILRTLAADQLESLEPVERLRVAYALGLAELFFGDGFAAVDLILPSALAEAQQLQLPEQQLELSLLRALYALQQGRYLVARTALEQGQTFALEAEDTLENAVLQLVSCELAHAAGDLPGFQKQQQILSTWCRREIQQRTVFMPLLSCYTAGLFLAKGDRQRALEIVEIALLEGWAAKNSHLQSRLLQLRGWIKALSGHEKEALVDRNMGLKLRQQAGGNFYHLENLLFAGATSFALHHYEQAAEYLAEGLAESRKCKEERFRAGIHAWMAVVQRKVGKGETASEHLRNFFELMKRHRVPFFWGMVPELIGELLPIVRQEADRILLQPLLAEHLLSVVGEDNELVPLLKVNCLGNFQLELEHKTFDLSQVGHASRQIFALLVGAPNHSLSLELMMATVWPESPPSRARNSFDAAHSRLRRALEGCFGKRIRRDYLVLKKGMLSLQHVQIDSAKFTETLENVRHYLQREHFWQAEHALWQMERLWSGEFLSGYDLDGKLPLLRRELTQLRLEQLGLLARLLQRRQQWEESARLLQRGLLLDPTYDPLIRQLLSLYRQHDSPAASLLLENYRTALQEEDYQPEEIEELIEALGF
ncbi:MAG: response regulator [Thermodesulfobacteriota bacterium]|nr:response regulator [Thermodesulfobacteriota bacterium]